MAMILYSNFSKLLLSCTIPTKNVNGYEICICVRGRKRERERERERKKEGEGERGRERESGKGGRQGERLVLLLL